MCVITYWSHHRSNNSIIEALIMVYGLPTEALHPFYHYKGMQATVHSSQGVEPACSVWCVARQITQWSV